MEWLRRLRTAHPLRHALLWIGVYIAVVYAGDALSAATGTTNAVTVVLLVGLSLAAVFFVRTSGWSRYYGLRRLRRSDLHRVWLYLPLAAIVGLQYVKGIDHALGVTVVLGVVTLMMCVGFLEELIFRGFLFTAIRERSSVRRAVVISGVTFGVGHLVNLGRGMGMTEQLLQVALGICLGIVLALLFAVTGTIVPAIAFHVTLNISGNVTGADTELEVLLVGASVLIATAYGAHLWHRLPTSTSRQSAPLSAAAPRSTTR